MALCWLASTAFDKDRIKVYTVNHNLSTMGVVENPAQVVKSVASLGLDCKVLEVEWKDVPQARQTKGRLQTLARQRRYELLLASCLRDNVRILLTAHNLDDDLATMIYRMSHMSGIEGIASMKPISPFPLLHIPEAALVFIGRPLLGVSKVAWCSLVSLGGFAKYLHCKWHSVDRRCEQRKPRLPKKRHIQRSEAALQAERWTACPAGKAA